MQLQPGQIFGDKYRILRLLGEGAMGAVYEGENVAIRRRVAIKVLHAGVSQHRDTVQRFEREAQAAGRIGSEHIVEVLDVGEAPDGSRYLVMELLEGTTLSDRIRARGRLGPAEAGPIAHELLGGLAAAHQAGIIHRDLKPANVFLLQGRGGQAGSVGTPHTPDFVKILDFGVSKFSALSGEDASMTRTGAVLGTPFYMSPEQAKGSRNIDPRSDLYAVGVILYECVTGHVPFSAETFNELLFKIVLEVPPPAETFVPDLDPSFAAIVRKAIERDPLARFQSALEFQQAIGDWIIKTSSVGGRPAPSLHMAIVSDQTGRIPWTDLATPAGPGPGGTVMLDLPPPSARRPPVAAPETVDLPIARGGLLMVVVFGLALVGGGVAAAFFVARSPARPTESATPAVSAPAPEPIAAPPSAVVSAEPAPEPPPRTSAAKATAEAEPAPPGRKKAGGGRPSTSPGPSATASAAAAVPSAPGRRISDEL